MMAVIFTQGQVEQRVNFVAEAKRKNRKKVDIELDKNMSVIAFLFLFLLSVTGPSYSVFGTL